MASDVALRTSMKSVLAGAGLAARDEDEGRAVVLDFTALDEQATRERRQEALQTMASLLLRGTSGTGLKAMLPRDPAGQRALASSGLMFALVDSGAQLFVAEAKGAAPVQGELVDAAGYQQLLLDAWAPDFNRFDARLRDAAVGSAGALVAEGATALANAQIAMTVADDDFLALLNPHRTNAGMILAHAETVASPFLRRVARRATAEQSTASEVLVVLGEALENVDAHAFRGIDVDRRRSLVTIEQVRAGGQDHLRVRIVDNGIGIPARLAQQLGETEPDQKRATKLVELAVGGLDDRLPGARGRGLSEMRRAAAVLQGRLTVATAGTGGTQITVRCRGDKPAEPLTDLVPVAGTVITLDAPLLPARSG
jgi:anti-sigma regulatory factor (Ser/Thr protein kinase)